MGTTANNGWPYPESTDFVADGATAIENLADAIDADFDSDLIKFDAVNSRVGINKTGPAYTLDVSGSANVSGGYLINGIQIGAWSTYTPTLGAWTANSLDFRYAVVKDICFVTFAADIATMSTTPTFSLPSGIASDTYIVATGQFLDIGIRWFDMLMLGSGSTAVSMWFKETAPGYVAFGTITSTSPITWASGDLLRGQFFYRVV